MSARSVVIRPATLEELPRLVRMLFDDALGAKREKFELPLPQCYVDAFETIQADPNNELVVAQLGDDVVGLLQMTFIPGLSYQGGWRALLEGVRVHESVRGQGIGNQLIEWAIDEARARGCHLVQLTSDKRRGDAIRFYENLGFKASHEGMKLHLGEPIR